MTKYRAKPTVIDGIRFASAREAERYSELRMLERAGKIKDLELQPVYTLQPKFTQRDGTVFPAIKYIADFRYLDLESGDRIVEDVKGFPTPVYRLKMKMFLFQHPEVEFREVK
jgi:hypothetical protein